MKCIQKLERTFRPDLVDAKNHRVSFGEKSNHVNYVEEGSITTYLADGINRKDHIIKVTVEVLERDAS